VVVIMLGFYKVVASGGHPVAVVAPPRQVSAGGGVVDSGEDVRLGVHGADGRRGG
jgi:hypothetical protein